MYPLPLEQKRTFVRKINSTSIKVDQGLGSIDMVKISELLINVVTFEQPKMLIGCD